MVVVVVSLRFYALKENHPKTKSDKQLQENVQNGFH